MVCGDDKQEHKENGIPDKESEQQPEQDETLQNPLAQQESTSHSTEQGSCTSEGEGRTKECEVDKGEHHDSSPPGNRHRWKQEERMVLEAGSKAAEIAKSVFGKPIDISLRQLGLR